MMALLIDDFEAALEQFREVKVDLIQ